MSCTVCNHPQSQAIDLALLNRTATLAQLGQRYQLSKSALHRHQQHLLAKMSRVQNRFQALLQESYLFMLNKFLHMVWGIAQESQTEGNSRQQLQAVRQGAAIMKFMAKLDGSLTDDTVHRLLANPQWAAAGSLLPTDPQFVAHCRQDLADSLFSPCAAEPPSAAPEELALMALSLPDLAPEADATPPPSAETTQPATPDCLSKREKGGKKAGKTPAVQGNNEENQSIKNNFKNSATRPGSCLETRNSELKTHIETLHRVPDLDAGQFDLAILNAIGAGRPRPELLDVFQAEIAAAA